MIEKFRDEYYFLSNFYKCPVVFDGQAFRCVESAFQAAKTLDKEERAQFQELTGRTAKRKGRKVELRKDWESVKVDVMREIVMDKFTRNKELAELLIATGDEELVEGNGWGDQFWGVCKGEGENWLGRILMDARDQIRHKDK